MEDILHLPINQQQSCYIDTVLVALLYPSTSILKLIPHENRSDIVEQLHVLTMELRNQTRTSIDLTRYVSNLRNLMPYRFTLNQPQDASEFIYHLLGIIGLDKNVNSRYIQVQTCCGNIITSRVEEAGIVMYVPYWTSGQKLLTLLDSYKDDIVLDIPIIHNNHLYTNIHTITDYIPKSHLIIHLDRASRGMINHTSVTVSEEICGLRLVAVIMHNGRNINNGHYTTYFRMKNNMFVFYDDTTINRMLVYTFDQCMKQMGQSGILFFYGILDI